jgi:ArsR family transcriptional regulator
MKYIAQVYKALSDETRLRIISLLHAGGQLCVCDLMAVLALPQSTVSRHLAYLKNSGMVNDERKGIWMYYSLRDNPQTPSPLFTVLKAQLKNSKRAEEDRQRLFKHLAAKDADACKSYP